MARVIGWALALSILIVAIPIGVMVAGLVVFPLDFLFRMVGGGGAAGLVGAYLRIAQDAFASTALPTWLPRLVFLVLAGAAAIAAVDGWLRRGRRDRGAAWWRLAPSPLSAAGAVTRRALGSQRRGATKQPGRDLAKRMGSAGR